MSVSRLSRSYGTCCGSLGSRVQRLRCGQACAKRSTGHRGYIDALVPGLCAIEMKSAGKDLEVAERQALDYIDDLTDVETPRWVISSDFHQFRILDLKAPDGADTRTFTLEELPTNSDLLAFLAGYQTSPFGNQQQEEASGQSRPDHGRPVMEAPSGFWL